MSALPAGGSDANSSKQHHSSSQHSHPPGTPGSARGGRRSASASDRLSAGATSATPATPAPGTASRPARQDDIPDKPGDKPLPPALAKKLKSLPQRLHGCELSKRGLNTLLTLCEELHDRQHGIEQAVREHGKDELVSGLRTALRAFVERLDRALVGEAMAPRQGGTGGAAKLPLSSLDMADIEKLSLALSSLASSPSTPIFLPGQLKAASAAMSSVVAKLMRRAQELKGAAVLPDGPMLNIANLVRRTVTAGLIDAQADAHEPTRRFCNEVFEVIAGWAGSDRILIAHDLGKTAALIETLYDHGLGGLRNRKQQAKLAAVVAWLLGKPNLQRMQQEKSRVALGSAFNLAKRLLEKGKLDPKDRKLDAMWEDLLRAMLPPALAADAQPGLEDDDDSPEAHRRRLAAREAAELDAMIGTDGRPLMAVANLLRQMQEEGLVQVWQKAASHASDACSTGPIDLAAIFARASAKVLAAVRPPQCARVKSVQVRSNLISFCKMWGKRLGKDTAPALAGQPTLAGLACAATALVQGLSPAELGKQRKPASLGGLLAGLGYLWLSGLVAQEGKPVQCLRAVLQAMRGLDCRGVRGHAVLPVLDKLLRAKLVTMDELQAPLDAMLGPSSTPRTQEDVHQLAGQVPPEDVVEPLNLPAPPEMEQARPRPTTLVGETRQLATLSSLPTWTAPVPVSLAPRQAGWEQQPARGAARLSAQSATLWKPIPVFASEEDESDPEEADTNRTSDTTTSTSTTTTTTTTTATTTTTTTSKSSAAATPAIQDPAAAAIEWQRLLKLSGADPASKLVKLAGQHPHLLQQRDEQGHAPWWTLLSADKPQALLRLIDERGYRPVLSDQEVDQLARHIFAMPTGDCAWRALEHMVRNLETSQKEFLHSAMQRQENPLERSEDIQRKLRLHLTDAVQKGDTVLLKKCLNAGAHAIMSIAARHACLRMAIDQGHADVFDILFAHESFRTALQPAGESITSLVLNAFDTAKLLNDTLDSAEYPAQLRDLPGIVKRLLREPDLLAAAAAPVKNGQHLLDLAIAYKLPFAVDLLLEHAELRELLDVADRNGWTPLARASRDGAIDVLRVMLKHPQAGVCLFTESRGLLPLELAACGGHVAVFKLLWSHHADARKQVAWSRRASMMAMAAASGKSEMVRELMEIEVFKATAGGVDPRGTNALVHALFSYSVSMVLALMKSESVSATLFTVCAKPSATKPWDGYVKGIGFPPPQSTTTAMSLAVEKDGAVVRALLDLPEVRQALFNDHEKCQALAYKAGALNQYALAGKLREMLVPSLVKDSAGQGGKHPGDVSQ